MASEQALFRRLRRALAWLAGSAVTLAGLELALAVGAGGVGHLPAYFVPTPDGSYALAAGSQSRYWHLGRIVTVTIGPDGTRSVPSAPEAREAPVAPITLHLVGDSQVFGWGLRDDETLPERLQQRLGSRVRVVNHGLPGQGPLGYFRTLATLPPDEPALLLLTEMNDFQDAYSAIPSLAHHCGYLVRPAGIGSRLPCRILGSHTAALLLDLRNLLATGPIPIPLGFNPKATVPAHVLCRRIENGLRSLAERRPGMLMVVTIPWEGEIVPVRRSAYAPWLPEVRAHTRLPGGTQLHRALSALHDPSTLFLPEDHHLSPEGADRVAEALAPLVESGTRNEFVGCREAEPQR